MSTSVAFSTSMSSWRAFSRVDLLPLPAHPVGVEAAGHRQALRVVADRQVGVAARPGGLGHLADRARAVAPARVRVQVAAQVGRARPAAAAGPRAPPRSRPGPRAAPAGPGGARGPRRPPPRRRASARAPSGPEDAVLGDRQPLPHGELAQADVVGGRAGGVLQQVAEGLGRADGQLQPHPGVGGDRRSSRRRATAPARPPGGRPGRPGAPRAARSAATMSMSCTLSRPRRRLPATSTRAPGTASRRSRAISSATGSALSDGDALLVVGLGLGVPGELGRDARLGRGAEAGHVAHPAVGDRDGDVVDRGDAQLPPERRRPLGPDAVEARDLGQADRDAVAQLGQRGDVAGLDELDDLRLEGRADVGQVDGAAAHRHLRHRGVGRADARRRAPVGEHPVAHRALELEQVADQPQPVRHLAVGWQLVGHPESLGTRPGAAAPDEGETGPRR